MPIVLNPYVRALPSGSYSPAYAIGKFFIDVIGMNAPMYTMPWALR